MAWEELEVLRTSAGQQGEGTDAPGGDVTPLPEGCLHQCKKKPMCGNEGDITPAWGQGQVLGRSSASGYFVFTTNSALLLLWDWRWRERNHRYLYISQRLQRAGQRVPHVMGCRSSAHVHLELLEAEAASPHISCKQYIFHVSS